MAKRKRTSAKKSPIGGLLRNRTFRLVSGVLVAVIVLWVAWGYLSPYVLNPIPKDIREQATYTLYYPDKLPKGYEIDRTSFKFMKEEQVVLYTLKSKGKPNIFIASQPKPEKFDFDEFTEKKLSNQKGIITPLGKAILATAEGSKLVSLQTDKGWIIISGKQELEDKPLEELADHMRAEK